MCIEFSLWKIGFRSQVGPGQDRSRPRPDQHQPERRLAHAHNHGGELEVRHEICPIIFSKKK